MKILKNDQNGQLDHKNETQKVWKSKNKKKSTKWPLNGKIDRKIVK